MGSYSRREDTSPKPLGKNRGEYIASSMSSICRKEAEDCTTRPVAGLESNKNNSNKGKLSAIEKYSSILPQFEQQDILKNEKLLKDVAKLICNRNLLSYCYRSALYFY